VEPIKFNTYIDLASERLGGKALLANDEFFAEKENLLKPGRGIFIPDKYHCVRFIAFSGIYLWFK